MGKTLFSCAVVVCVVAAVAIGTGAWPESSLAEERQDDNPVAGQSKQRTQAIDSFVDLLLLARDEQTAKENFETLNAKDWAAVKAEISRKPTSFCTGFSLLRVMVL